MTSTTTTAESVRDLNAFSLANMANCAYPDDDESAGARFLVSVRDAITEAIESGTFGPFPAPRDATTVVEIADNAPDVYTYTRWQEFSDLQAWNETPELGEWPDDLTATAGVALYQIAERLCYALLQEWREALPDDDEDDEVTDDDADDGTMPASFGGHDESECNCSNPYCQV